MKNIYIQIKFNMSYPKKKDNEDHTKQSIYNNSFNRIKNDLLNISSKINEISSCDIDFLDEKENIIEIKNLLKNLTHQENFESYEDSANSCEEIRCILRKKNSNLSVVHFRRAYTCLKISPVGRILHSDNKFLSKIIHPDHKNKQIPIRVSNPIYKNFDRDN